MTSVLVAIGSYTEPAYGGSGGGSLGGIHLLRLVRTDHSLHPEAVIACPPNPSFLVRHDRCLYAVHELKTWRGQFGGAASAFRLDPATGHPVLLNTVPTHGTDPCHLCVTPDGRHLLVANYSSGHLTVLPILADGSLGDAIQVIAHEGSSVHPTRQTSPHVHHVSTDARGAIVHAVDLGTDQIHTYRRDAVTGQLTSADPPFVSTVPGAGPRQLIRRSHEQAFIVNELASSITECRIDAQGAIILGATRSTLPPGHPGPNSCAELCAPPRGDHLYVSNRGLNAIAIFKADTAIGPTLLHNTPTGGSTPRHFAFSDDNFAVLIANQDSSTVVALLADPTSGALGPAAGGRHVGSPSCVLFLP